MFGTVLVPPATRGQGRLARLFVSLVLAWCASRSEHAHGNTPLRVILVCTAQAPCEAFAARLRGQTSDLLVDVTTVVQPELPAELDESASAVDTLAGKENSTVALWWRQGDLVALLRDPPPGRVLVRTVWPATSLPLGHQPDTAELEAAALIARTAIVAAKEGRPIGVPRKPLADPAPPPAENPPDSTLLSTLQFSTSAGWNVVWDGLPHGASHGFEARVAAKLYRLRAGGFWIERATEDLVFPVAKGTLARRQPGVFLELDAVATRKFSASVEARVGWLMLEVTPMSGPFQRPEQFTFTSLGLAARFRYAIAPDQVHVWAAAGFDHVNKPLSVGLRNAERYTPLWHMSKTMPTLSVGVELLFPKLR